MDPIRKSTRFSRMTCPLSLFASLIACAPLAAQETGPAYTMTVIVDSAHGAKVAAGKYEAAIDKITAGNSSRNRYSKQTNLCVAYTKLGELDQAAAACEAALAVVLDEPENGRSYPGPAQSDRSKRLYLALALSNLGVLQAAQGSPDLARKAFREALELDTGLSAPQINLARLGKDEVPGA